MLRKTALALTMALMAQTASAQDLVPWGNSELWTIAIDPTLGNGCLAQAEFADGSLVRIGLDRNVGSGYVMAFNESWGDIEEGVVYPISFGLDGEVFEGEATGIYLNGVPGADIFFDNEEFFMGIAQRQTMTLAHDGTEVMAIDLTGSFQALEAVLQCQDEQG